MTPVPRKRWLDYVLTSAFVLLLLPPMVRFEPRLGAILLLAIVADSLVRYTTHYAAAPGTLTRHRLWTKKEYSVREAEVHKNRLTVHTAGGTKITIDNLKDAAAARSLIFPSSSTLSPRNATLAR